MPFSTAALAQELTTNPKGYLYPPDNDAATAAALNLSRAEESVQRTVVKAFVVFGLIDPAEMLGLQAAARVYVQTALSMVEIDISNQVTRDAFSAIFTQAGSPITRARLAAFQTRSGSRAEALFGEGVVVSDQQVAVARGRV